MLKTENVEVEFLEDMSIVTLKGHHDKIYCGQTGKQLIEELPGIVMSITTTDIAQLNLWLHDISEWALPYLKSFALFKELAARVDDYVKNPTSINFISDLEKT